MVSKSFGTDKPLATVPSPLRLTCTIQRKSSKSSKHTLKSTSARIYIADDKFFDVHTQLQLRGFKRCRFPKASEYFIKWRNDKRLRDDFGRKGSVRGANRDSQILNHITGTRVMGTKSQICWRLRAADRDLPGKKIRRSHLFYPVCWNLGRDADFCCFVVTFAHVAAQWVLRQLALVTYPLSDDLAKVKTAANGVVAAVAKVVGEGKAPTRLLAVDITPVGRLLRFGTSIEAIASHLPKCTANFRTINTDKSSKAASAATAAIVSTPGVSKDLTSNSTPGCVGAALNPTTNLWICKPGAKARGEGIFISGDLAEITTRVGRMPEASGYEAYLRCTRAMISGPHASAAAKIALELPKPKPPPSPSSDDPAFVVQQYIERPLLIENKKFDIRQWVLLSSVQPMEVWFMSECYLRFCGSDYDLASVATDRFAHISNDSVQKRGPDYNTATVGGVSGLMRSSVWAKERLGTDVWDNIVKQMQAISVQVLLAHRAHILQTMATAKHPGTFEWLGFDFMVDATHTVWLLEANLSPDVSHNTPVLKELCRAAHSHFFDLLLGPNSSSAAANGHNKSMRWIQIYRESDVDDATKKERPEMNLASPSADRPSTVERYENRWMSDLEITRASVAVKASTLAQYILDSKSASHVESKDIFSNSTDVEVTSDRNEGTNAVVKADDGSCDDSSSDDEL